MRRLATVCLGLALSAPTSAWSQVYGPAPDLTLENEQLHGSALEAPGYQQIQQQLQQAQAMGMTNYHGGHVCEKCARKLPNHIAVDPSAAPTGFFGRTSNAAITTYGSAPVVSSNGGCTMCQQGQLANNGPSVPSHPGVAYVGGATQTAGVAYVGGPSDSQGNTRYLGVVGSIEPVPVGVIRTNYNQINESSPSNGNGMARAGHDPYMPNPSMMPAPGPMPMPAAPMGAPMATPGHRHVNILGHMLGMPRHHSWREDRQKQETRSPRHDPLQLHRSTPDPTARIDGLPSLKSRNRPVSRRNTRHKLRFSP